MSTKENLSKAPEETIEIVDEATILEAAQVAEESEEKISEKDALAGVAEEEVVEAKDVVEIESNPSRGAPTRLIQLSSAIDNGNDLISVVDPGNEQKKEIAQMKACINAGTVCYGHIVGVEESSRSGSIIVIKRNTLRIVVLAEDFFAHSQMKDIESASQEERFLRYRRKASHMFGAAVSFIPKAFGETDDGVPFVAASRKEAMEQLQHQHFFRQRADAKLGSVTTASIISVGPRYVTVECLGVESVIGTGALSAFDYIENAADEFHNGEGLRVAISKLEVDKEGRKIVDIAFSHALVERSEAMVEAVNESMLGGRYLAKVVSVLPKFYVVIIKGFKIRGLVPVDAYMGDEPLIAGDSVVTLVTGINKEKNMIIGRCLKA